MENNHQNFTEGKYKRITEHKTGTRKEKLDLLQAGKELTRRSDKLAQRRRELPRVRTGKEYRYGRENKGPDRAPGGRNDTGVWWRSHDEYKG